VSWAAIWIRIGHVTRSIWVIARFTLSAITAPLLADHVFHTSFEEQNLLRTYARPTLDPPAYLLGADEVGRSQVVRLLYGGQVSLFIGFVAALMNLTLGVALGLLAGYLVGLVALHLRYPSGREFLAATGRKGGGYVGAVLSLVLRRVTGEPGLWVAILGGAAAAAVLLWGLSLDDLGHVALTVFLAAGRAVAGAARAVGRRSPTRAPGCMNRCSCTTRAARTRIGRVGP